MTAQERAEQIMLEPKSGAHDGSRKFKYGLCAAEQYKIIDAIAQSIKDAERDAYNAAIADAVEKLKLANDGDEFDIVVGMIVKAIEALKK